MGAPAPTNIPSPFAASASGGNINFPIPATPPGSPANLASWSIGFPAITMQPEIAGGLPPFGQDFNGVLYTLSGHIFSLQAGQPYLWSSSLAGIISGYEAGATLGMADGSGLWLNANAGNVTNPDNDPTAAGWVPGISYGITTISGLTGGVVTLKPSQSRRNVLILNGTLASNLSLVLPNTQQQWLITNNTTGAFTTTAKTAAGTGVTIPQGGPSSPVGVWGDGTNIYPTVAPLSVPISIAPTPLTLLERDNSGYSYSVYYNQSSPLENPTIGAVVVQNSGADGFFRKISLANFVAQLFSVTNSANGSITLGPIIIKWGSFSAPASGAVGVTFGGGAFPNGCYAVVPSQGDSANYGYPFGVSNLAKTGFTADAAVGGINAGTCYYIAIGH